MVPTERYGRVLRSSGKSGDNSKSYGHFFVRLDESGHGDFVSEKRLLLVGFIRVNDTSRGVVIANIDIEGHSIEDALQRRLVGITKTSKSCKNYNMSNQWKKIAKIFVVPVKLVSRSTKVQILLEFRYDFEY